MIVETITNENPIFYNAEKNAYLYAELSKIQQRLKAPKNQRNNFGGYNYRSCEDILEAVKPLLGELTLVITDEIVEIGNRVYVKATATLSDGAHCVSSSSYAREPESKKGSDESQITGAASSYARKYALNGLFLIDDTRDADVTNDHGKKASTEKPKSKVNESIESKDSFKRPVRQPKKKDDFEDI